MKNYCDICFTCNDTEFCHSCSQPYIMWGTMTSFDDIMRCVEKWRVYNGQTVKQ